MPLEIRLLRSDQLQEGFQRGDVDLILSGNNYFKPFVDYHSLEPVLTIQRRGISSQACCLIIRESSGFKVPEQLKDRRLAYISPDLLEAIQSSFFFANPVYGGLNYFKETVRCKNGTDALLKLQLNQVDTVLGTASLQDLAERLKANLTQKVTVLAWGKKIPFLALLLRPSEHPVKTAQIQTLLRVLEDANHQPEGQALLGYFNMDRFIPYNGDAKPGEEASR
jgi:ABC-type phosphate/phosphonate transport system substrate-binding protein